MARKREKGVVAYWLRETSETHQPNATCGPHCSDPVSKKSIAKEIFMRQSGKSECQIFDDTKKFLFNLYNSKVLW